MKEGFFEGKYLLNLDSEDEGELFIGCAGGVDTIITFDYEKETMPTGNVAYKLSVSGLSGGHSGDDINKGLGNSIKILNRFLWRTNTKYDLRLAMLEGGNLRNAIPREAYTVFTIHQDDIESMSNISILAVTFILERIWRKSHENQKEIIYEKIELIKPSRREELLADIRNRTGLNVTRLSIGKIDFMKDIARITIFYDSIDPQDYPTLEDSDDE